MDIQSRSDFLENKIFNKERQIISAEKQYDKVKEENRHIPEIYGAFIFIPSMFLAFGLHYYLFFQAGMSSLFITPATVLALFCLTEVGIKIGKKSYQKKLDACSEKIQKLKDEYARFQKQLQKLHEMKNVKSKTIETSNDTFITGEALQPLENSSEIEPVKEPAKILVKTKH